MNLTIRSASVILFILLLSFDQVAGQNVRLKNPSFEGWPRRGILDIVAQNSSSPIDGWVDYGSVLFPKTSPPDLQSATTGFWDMEDRDVPDGKTFLVMVTREDDSYESLMQELDGTLYQGQCYDFSITLARSATYLSHTVFNQTVLVNFNEPVVFRLWGGSPSMETRELLAETGPVVHEEWRKYTFTITPQSDVESVTIEAFYEVPTLFGYNGNLCLDDMSDFVHVECGQGSGNHVESVDVFDIYLSDLEREGSVSVSGLEMPTIPKQHRYISDLYFDARKYGLYRYVRSLDSIDLNKMLVHLDSLNLDHEEWQVAIQLGLEVDSNGYTPESQEKIEYFNTAKNWRKIIEAYFIENEIPLDKME